jgi:transposase InsO family protein
VKFEFIRAERALFSVALLCAVLEVTRSGFYAWLSRGASIRRRRDAQLAVEVAATHKRNRGVYGSPRIHADLRARGVRVGKKRVARLMREQGLRARRTRRFVATTDSRHHAPIAPNLLARDFTARAPNERWVTDVTFIPTTDGMLYLAVVLDLFSRRVVGWATSASNDTELALAALGVAARARKPPVGLVHHSDRGSTYASDAYQRALANSGIVASMSRAGDCWDNAVAESFFATLKEELPGIDRCATRAAAAELVRDYIESFYNPTRRHSHNGYLSPIEFELKAFVAMVAA